MLHLNLFNHHALTLLLHESIINKVQDRVTTDNKVVDLLATFIVVMPKTMIKKIKKNLT